MRFPRSAGTLVHPTSFPSPYGMGDLGPAARIFLEFLKVTGQTIWQVLPLTPVSHGNSPYNSYSAFAGNAYLISPDILHEKGLLERHEVEEARLPVTVSADYDQAYQIKDRLLEMASARFYSSLDSRTEKRLEAFKKSNEYWIHDFALFMVISRRYSRQPWNHWSSGLAGRDPAALLEAEKEYNREIRQEIWMQFEFFNQWEALKQEANRKGIRILGDIPIFVDHNSSDVWANRRYFSVDKQGARKIVAGVPPDYFSETGQLWGNPVYEWDALKKDGYDWWIERFRQMFTLFDAIRVDHFRGFEASWQVPVSETTAMNGQWIKGPGAHLFETILEELGELPIIAEDLGVITPDVEKLRDDFSFPGMNVLQFAFDGDPENGFLPHNYNPNSAVYSGTHDNDTSLGWYLSASEKERHLMRVYTRSDGSAPNWELIRLAMQSVADQAIFPLQDFMNLDSAHRMNLPGTARGNWVWRYTPDMLENIDTRRILNLNTLFNRNSGWELDCRQVESLFVKKKSGSF